nr:immunoglobulin light chain junction region [Macaca mulatta]
DYYCQVYDGSEILF